MFVKDSVHNQLLRGRVAWLRGNASGQQPAKAARAKMGSIRSSPLCLTSSLESDPGNPTGGGLISVSLSLIECQPGFGVQGVLCETEAPSLPLATKPLDLVALPLHLSTLAHT